MYQGNMYPDDRRGQRGAAPLDPLRQGMRWFKLRSMPEKCAIGAAGALLVCSCCSPCALIMAPKLCLRRAHNTHVLQTLGFLYYIIEDHDTLFILSEGCHLAGLGILIYKLQQKKSAAGTECPDYCVQVYMYQ